MQKVNELYIYEKFFLKNKLIRKVGRYLNILT